MSACFVSGQLGCHSRYLPSIENTSFQNASRTTSKAANQTNWQQVESGRPCPAEHQFSPPSIRLRKSLPFAGVATQTDLIIVNREHPIVNFLENSEAVLEPLSIPNCYHFASSRQYAKSPKVPIIIEGVCVPVVVDRPTGAKVSILPFSILQTVLPHQSLPYETREVRSLDGALVSIKGPLLLRIQICNVTLEHSFYFIESGHVSLMGYDLISAASLVIEF